MLVPNFVSPAGKGDYWQPDPTNYLETLNNYLIYGTAYTYPDLGHYHQS
jgi:hypothetical protein